MKLEVLGVDGCWRRHEGEFRAGVVYTVRAVAVTEITRSHWFG